MKRFSFAVSLLAGAIAALVSPSHAAEPVEIKLATILPSGTSGHLGLMEMRDAWHKTATPAVKLTVYAGSADGESLLVKKMRAGQIHAALISAVHPTDFKTMKMFVWTGEPQQLTLMRSLGYQPVGLETEQILPSLQTGMIDVVPVPPFLANALQYNRFVRHMVDLNWVPIVGAAVVRTDTWEKISATDRAQLLKAAEAAGEKIRMRTRQEDQAAIDAMQKRGLTVHLATPEIAAAWQAVAESVYPQIRGAIVPADLFDQVRAHVAEFRAANASAARP